MSASRTRPRCRRIGACRGSRKPSASEAVRRAGQRGRLLRDLWREQHPGGVSPLAGEKKDGGGGGGGGGEGGCECWERPNNTWRGQRSRTPGVVARCEGKAMRLDYFLLAPARIGVLAVATKRKVPVDSNSSNSHSSHSNSNSSSSSSNSSNNYNININININSTRRRPPPRWEAARNASISAEA